MDPVSYKAFVFLSMLCDAVRVSCLPGSFVKCIFGESVVDLSDVFVYDHLLGMEYFS